MNEAEIKLKLQSNLDLMIKNTIRLRLLISEFISNDFLTFEEAEKVVSTKFAKSNNISRIILYINNNM